MRFALLDQMRCSCGNEELRLEGAVTQRAPSSEEQSASCLRFCGLRQRPVIAGQPRPPECRECGRQTILQGTLRCQCGQRWPIVDGVPSFSSRRFLNTPSNRFQVTETNPRTDPRWEPFVRAHPHASPFHHPGWLRALEEEYGQTRLHLACEGLDGQLLAVLPMFYTRGLPINFGGHVVSRRLASLPRTPVGGVLSRDPEATLALLQTAVDCSRSGAGAQLQIKTEDPGWDGLVHGLSRTSWRPTFVTPLPEKPEHLQFGNSTTRHRLKWAVNKATKLGVRVREAQDESDLRAWYPLYLEVMRQNAVPPRPYRFFEALWKLLRPAGVLRLLLAERHQESRHTLLAGSILLTFGGMACYAFTGGRKQDFAFHPNDLIQWEAIHESCRMGARRYDFGEVPGEHRQLVHFKSKWGAEPTPLYRYYSPLPVAAEASDSQSAGWLRQCVAAGWRQLPLCSTALLGDWIYSYL